MNSVKSYHVEYSEISPLKNEQNLNQCKVKILRLVSFIFAFLSMCMAFSVFACTVYMGAIKTTFNYSQSQVELLISMEFIGLAFTLPAGRLIEKFGTRFGAFASMIFCGGPHFLVWSACLYPDFYSKNFLLLVFYFLLIGFGNGLSYLTAMAATICNFSVKWRCTAISILSSATSVSGMILIAIWNGFYHSTSLDNAPVLLNDSSIYLNSSESAINSTKTLEDFSRITTDNLTNFFFFLSLSYTLINLGATIFYGKYLPFDKLEEKINDLGTSIRSTSNKTKDYGATFSTTKECYPKKVNDFEDSLLSSLLQSKGFGTITYNDERNPILRSMFIDQALPSINSAPVFEVKNAYIKDIYEGSDSGYSNMSEDDEDDVLEKNTTILSIFGSVKYHLLAWPCILLIAVAAMNGNNINTYLVSMNLKSYEESIPFIVQWFGIPGKLAIGWLSDSVIKKCPRSTFVILGCFMNAVAFIISIFLADELAVIVTSQFCTNFGSVVVWCLCPCIILEEFGERSFTVLWGFITFNYGLITFAVNYLFGTLYDEMLVIGEEICYGKQCFFGINVICSILFIATTLMSIIFLRKKSA